MYQPELQIQTDLVQPEELSSIELRLRHIWDSTQYDAIETTEISQFGHSYRSLIKDLYRVQISTIFELLLQQSGVDPGVILDADKTLIESVTPEEIAVIENVVSEATELLQNWNLYLSGEESSYLSLVAKETYNRLHEYYYQQVSTLLGEIVIFHDVEQSFSPQLQEFISTYGLRQREFKYQINDQNLQQLLSSAERRSDMPGATEREMVEEDNIAKVIILGQESCVDGDVLIEVSPPLHYWQEDVMLRVYERQSGVWEVNQYSLPYQRYTAGSIASDFRQRLVTNGYSFEICNNNKTLVKMENVVLANLIRTAGDSGTVVDTFLKSLDLDIDLNTIEENDSFIHNQIHGKLMPYFNQYGNDLISNLSSTAVEETELQGASDRIAEMVQAARLVFTDKEQLAKQNLSVDQIAAATDLSTITYASQGLLDYYIAENVGSLHMKSEGSDCLYSAERTLGLDKMRDQMYMGGLDYQTVVNNTEVNSVTIGKDGTKLEWLKITDPKSGQEHTVLKNCPLCGFRGLDPCWDKCPGCKKHTSTIRKLYEQGLIKQTRTEMMGSKSDAEGGLLAMLFDLLSLKWLL